MLRVWIKLTRIRPLRIKTVPEHRERPHPDPSLEKRQYIIEIYYILSINLERKVQHLNLDVQIGSSSDTLLYTDPNPTFSKVRFRIRNSDKKTIIWDDFTASYCYGSYFLSLSSEAENEERGVGL